MKILIADEYAQVFQDGSVEGGALTPADAGVILEGCGGETVSFQLVVAADDGLLDGVALEIGSLSRPGSGHIPPENVEAYRIGFVRAPSAGYRAWKPARWWPDPLFPLQPFRINRGDFQPLWINLRIPRDAQGSFCGQILVRAAGREPVRVAIRLRAWRFNLPLRQSLVNMFDFSVADEVSGFVPRYGPLDGAGFEPFCKFMRYLTDHSVNRLFYNGPLFGSGLIRVTERRGHFASDFRKAEKMLQLFKQLGLGFNHWHGPVWPQAGAYLAFNPTYRRFRSLGQKMYRNRRFNQCLLDLAAAGHRHLKKIGIADRCFAYLYDEPHKRWHLKHMGRLSRGLKAMCPQTRQLAAIGQPAAIQATLDKDLPVDIIVGHLSYYDPKIRARIVESGREYWWYTSNWPSSHLSFWVDEPMLHHRILYWLTWRYGVPGFGYWNTNVWNYRSYGYDNITAGRRMEWPCSAWNITPTSGGTNAGSADGQLVYPGENGPIGSLRFEAIRHGYQDHACLSLLESKVPALAGGRRQKTEKLLAAIRREVGGLRSHARHPEVLKRLRRQVGRALEALNTGRASD